MSNVVFTLSKEQLAFVPVRHSVIEGKLTGCANSHPDKVSISMISDCFTCLILICAVPECPNIVYELLQQCIKCRLTVAVPDYLATFLTPSDIPEINPTYC